MDILNGRGESVNKLPGDRRRLLLELKVIWHGTVDLCFKIVATYHIVCY